MLTCLNLLHEPLIFWRRSETMSPIVFLLLNVLKTFFNGWSTSARFQKADKVCLLCSDCVDGGSEDSLEHYAQCTFQWTVFAKFFRQPIFPVSMARFLGLQATSLDFKVFHAVHMYAVMRAHSSRKHSGYITGVSEVESLIYSGHRTAQLYHKGLRKRYREYASSHAAHSSNDSYSTSSSSSSSSTS